MRHALWAGLLVVCACKGKPADGQGAGTASGSAPPPPRPAVVPVDPNQAKVTLGCLFDRARTEREVLTVLAEDAPVPVVRMAGLAAIERAREDGETPAIHMMADVLDALAFVEDHEGMRAVFAQLDAIPSAKGAMRTNNLGPLRARAGLPVTGDVSSEAVQIARELALAGQAAEAQALYAKQAPVDTSAAYHVENHIGVLAALGKSAEIRTLIAGAKEEDRLKLAGLWLETVLRGKGPAADAIAEVRAQIPIVPERGVTWFPERVLFRRAQRTGRAGELGAVYRDLKARYTKDSGPVTRLSTEYDLARAMGDDKEIAELVKAPQLADKHAVWTAPFDRALEVVLATKYPTEDLVRLWQRSVASGADGAWGTALAQKTCPPAKPAVTPTPAAPGLTLTVTEKAKKTQFECKNRDLVIRLAKGEEHLAEEVVEGECHGACTAKERRDGQRQLDEIQKRIDEGDGSQSETDYNFTQCIYAGPIAGRLDKVAGRDIALFADHYIGAHDIDNDRWRLALEVCGQLHVTRSFGERYAGSWGEKELVIREFPDQRMIVVEGRSDRWTGTVFRLALPACPGTPVEESIDTE
ncbi:MAG: hypothetical protein JNL83_03350 [Myxococcales bacterium]|nr:hypothetical protein [Myxococcales bacterium]